MISPVGISSTCSAILPVDSQRGMSPRTSEQSPSACPPASWLWLCPEPGIWSHAGMATWFSFNSSPRGWVWSSASGHSWSGPGLIGRPSLARSWGREEEAGMEENTCCPR